MGLDPNIPHGDVTYAIIGAAMRVHSRVGPGLKVGLLFNFGRKRLEYKRILPPKVLEGWQLKVARFLWRPDHAGPVPEIVSPDTVRVVKPEKPPSLDDPSMPKRGLILP